MPTFGSNPHFYSAPITARCTGDDIATAVATVETFIHEQATTTADELGFSYVKELDAPSRYPDLVAAFDHSLKTGMPLPISSENSGTVIYQRPETNFALRFWHDVNHVRQQLTFGLVDELDLSLWHLQRLEVAGYPRHSLPWRILHADLTGQGYLLAFGGRFPSDQERFVRGCLTDGFDHGLLRELREQ